MRVALLVGCVAAAVGLAGCLAEADHSNPLDPLSEDYVSGAVLGVVLGGDEQPVADADVRLEPAAGGEARATLTAADGAFQFWRVSPGAYRVVTTKPQHTTAEASVTVAEEAVEVNFSVNGLPRITDVAVRTVLFKQGVNPAELRIEAEAAVEDPDGPASLDSVWLALPGLGARLPLAPLEAPGAYGLDVNIDEVPEIESPEDLLLQEAVIHARDRQGVETTSDPFRFLHVFTEPIEAQAPSDFTDLRESPSTLQWTRVDPQTPRSARPVTYRIVLERSGSEQPALLDTTVSDSADRFIRVEEALGGPLGLGRYEWSVTAEDRFGNRNRDSAGFRVLQ